MKRAQWVEFDGYEVVRGRECLVFLERRGWSCDRGRFLAKLCPDLGTALARDIGDADGWPRYYFDEERAKLEVEAWLVRREQFIEQTPEEAKAQILAQLEREAAIVDAMVEGLINASKRQP